MIVPLRYEDDLRLMRAQESDAGDEVAYPVDTVSLSGRGANDGLTALLRLDGPGSIEGWIFELPSRRRSLLGGALPSVHRVPAGASPVEG